MRYFLKSRLAVAGSAVVLIISVLSIFAPLICPFDPQAFSADQLSPPSSTHLFGTDSFGRDVVSLLLDAGGGTLSLAVLTLVFSAVIGIAWGVVAGYAGAFTDTVLSRAMEALMSFPAMMAALLVMGIFGTTGRIPLMVAIAVTLAPRFARVMRGSTMPFREADFVLAARATGAAEVRILLRHVLPNLVAPILVLCSIYLPYVILLESSLSFLGLGAPPDAPTWGRIVAEGRQYFRIAPWLVLFPGAAITLSAIGFNLLGDGLRDVLDPHVRGKLVTGAV